MVEERSLWGWCWLREEEGESESESEDGGERGGMAVEAMSGFTGIEGLKCSMRYL